MKHCYTLCGAAITMACHYDREVVHVPSCSPIPPFREIKPPQVYDCVPMSTSSDWPIVNKRIRRNQQQPFYRQLKKYRKP